MIKVVSIVEGDGEVAALPILLRRISNWLSPQALVQVREPIRVRRDRFLNKDDEFVKQVKLAAHYCVEPGWILILLDADDDCPKHLAKIILERASAVAQHRRISVVLANREYEAWFIAAAASLDGKRGFALKGTKLPDPEAVRGAKEWMNERIPQGRYRETTDQAGFCGVMDLDLASKRSRSFRKLCSEWTRQMAHFES